MNRPGCVAALVAAVGFLAMTSEKGSSQTAQKAAAVGGTNAPGPFEINVTGSKTASVLGRDASFCVTTSGETKVFALSLVQTKWAVSIGGMGDRPVVGAHVMGTDMTKGLTADLTDKTTGPKSSDWVHSELKSGTVTITRSDDAKLVGTYEFVATPSTGGEWHAKGTFQANPTKC